MLEAVIFDVDGTLAETEHDGHRVAFNRAFAAMGLPYRWDGKTYHRLLSVAGGRERLLFFLARNADDLSEQQREELARELHRLKTLYFREIIALGGLTPRPGVLRLLDELHKAGIRLAIATTGSRDWVEPLLLTLLGKSRSDFFEIILTGEDVHAKKPSPEVYHQALEKLSLPPSQVMAIEDSRNGLLAAHAAGIACVIVRNRYSEPAEHLRAELVVDSLGEESTPAVVLSNPHAVEFSGVVSHKTLLALQRALHPA